MATGYIYNGYGQYEERDGEKGANLGYCGTQFWLPFGKVTPIPNWTFRLVDHNKSTGESGEAGELVYQTLVVSGERIVEELTQTQQPFKNAELGIIPIKGKKTSETVVVHSGFDEDGQAIYSEVVVRTPTESELSLAEKNALAFKKAVIQEYFQSKRERMSGSGKGQLHPTGLIRIFMDELNVQDLDDVTTHQKPAGGLDMELIRFIISEMKDANEINEVKLIEAIQKSRENKRPSVEKARPKSLGLAEHAARYDAEQASKEKGE